MMMRLAGQYLEVHPVDYRNSAIEGLSHTPSLGANSLAVQLVLDPIQAPRPWVEFLSSKSITNPRYSTGFDLPYVACNM